MTEWLSFSIYVAAIYDYDVRFTVFEDDGVTPRKAADGSEMTTDHLQFKENFGLTLTNKFLHKARGRKN